MIKINFSRSWVKTRNLVNKERCLNANCNANCSNEECQFCSSCLNDKDLKLLSQAYLEHMQRGEMMRIYPSKKNFDNDFINELSENNKFMTEWFKQKCEEESEWC